MAITSISDLARVHGVERRDHVALRVGDRGITYGELDERTSRVANALLAEGIDPQDRVAFLDKNGPEYFDVLIGGAKVNAVDVAVNWRLARTRGRLHRQRRPGEGARSWARSSCPCSTRSRATSRRSRRS